MDKIPGIDSSLSIKVQKSLSLGSSKEPVTKPEKAPEAKAEFLAQLKDMGFPEELARKALIKVKNESVAAAVEAAVTLQTDAIVNPHSSLSEKKKSVN